MGRLLSPNEFSTVATVTSVFLICSLALDSDHADIRSASFRSNIGIGKNI